MILFLLDRLQCWPPKGGFGSNHYKISVCQFINYKKLMVGERVLFYKMTSLWMYQTIKNSKKTNSCCLGAAGLTNNFLGNT